MADGRKLFRSKDNRMISGVCGGIAEMLGVDATIARLIWVLVSFFLGFFIGGIIAYIICIIIIPEKPDHIDI